MLIKVRADALIGPALDWAVSRITKPGIVSFNGKNLITVGGVIYSPSTDWAQGGPIIERELICLQIYDGQTDATKNHVDYCPGPTPLIAAMRCYVVSELGKVIEIPEEL